MCQFIIIHNDLHNVYHIVHYSLQEHVKANHGFWWLPFALIRIQGRSLMETRSIRSSKSINTCYEYQIVMAPTYTKEQLQCHPYSHHFAVHRVGKSQNIKTSLKKLGSGLSTKAQFTKVICLKILKWNRFFEKVRKMRQIWLFCPVRLAFCVTAFCRTELSRPGRSPGIWGDRVQHVPQHVPSPCPQTIYFKE